MAAYIMGFIAFSKLNLNEKVINSTFGMFVEDLNLDKYQTDDKVTLYVVKRIIFYFKKNI